MSTAAARFMTYLPSPAGGRWPAAKRPVGFMRYLPSPAGGRWPAAKRPVGWGKAELLGIYPAQGHRRGVSPARVHPGDGHLLARLVGEQCAAEVIDVGDRGPADRRDDRVPGDARSGGRC